MKSTATQQAYRDAMNRRARMAAEVAAAAKAATATSSFWLCPPDEFYDKAHARAKELSAVTVSYVKPWGVA